MSAVRFSPVSPAELIRYHGARRGTEALQRAIIAVYGPHGATNLGIYNRRRVAGSREWSLHAVGRAGDIGVPSIELGDIIALTMVSKASRIGVQEVIFNRQRWTIDGGAHPYHGDDSHRTHIHWSHTRLAADNPAPRDDQVAYYRGVLLAS